MKARSTRLVLFLLAWIAGTTTAFANERPIALLSGDIPAARGDIVTVDGSASFDPDGDPLAYQWVVTRPDGTEFTLPDAVTVSFVADQPGDYEVVLNVFDGSLLSIDCIIEVEVDPNARPIATADAAFAAGNTVQLTGAGTDPDGDTVTFFWELEGPAGSGATLDDETAMNPTFDTDLDGVYTATLVVTDEHGLDSLPATASINTLAMNRPPEAIALPEVAEVTQGETIDLDGTNSFDPDGDPITFLWTVDRPGESVLADETSPTPTFTPMATGDFIIELIVTDSFGENSEPDTVIVRASVSTNMQPTAAGTATPVDPYVGVDTVTLDASASFDPDGDSLEYLWTVSGPPGSTAVPVDPTAEITSFVPDVAGDYNIQLMVTDPGGLSDTIVIPITAFDPPVVVITDIVQDEGDAFNGMVFTLSVEGIPRPGDIITVRVLTEDGTATAVSEDYNQIPETPIQTRTLNALNSYSATVFVGINGDTTDECHEFFLVQLQHPLVAPDERGIGTGILLDDEPPAGEDILNTDGTAVAIDCPTTAELRDELVAAGFIPSGITGLGAGGEILTGGSTGGTSFSHLALLALGLIVTVRNWGRRK